MLTPKLLKEAFTARLFSFMLLIARLRRIAERKMKWYLILHVQIIHVQSTGIGKFYLIFGGRNILIIKKFFEPQEHSVCLR